MTLAIAASAVMLLALVAGLALTFFVVPATRDVGRTEFDQRCAAIGLEPLQAPSPLYIACGGEVSGRRVMLLLVGTRSPDGLPPRVDILAEAGLTHPEITKGGAQLRPDTAPRITGTSPAVEAALTPSLRTAVTDHLGGRFAFSVFDTFAPTGAVRTMVKSRWPGDWRGLMIQTWVDPSADAATLRATLTNLLATRDVLATSPGMTPT